MCCEMGFCRFMCKGVKRVIPILKGFRSVKSKNNEFLRRKLSRERKGQNIRVISLGFGVQVINL